MRTLGLIGKKLSHSLSQVHFREKFRQLGLDDVDYTLFELEDIEELPRLLQRQPSLVGFNVTVPYKEDVLKYLDELEDVAKQIGAVNTVVVNDGLLTGYNTDVVGFEKTLIPLLPKLDEPTKALVLGTGGGSKAVQYVLRKNNVDVTPVTSKLHQGVLTYEEVTEAIIAHHQLIVNTTPLGMLPNAASFPDIPYDAITSSHILIDLVYNPLETQFLKFGQAKRATCVNGITMLYAQADAAWEIWKPIVLQ